MVVHSRQTDSDILKNSASKVPLHILVSPAPVFAAQDVTVTYLFLSVLVCSFFALSWEEDGTESVVSVVL